MKLTIQQAQNEVNGRIKIKLACIWALTEYEAHTPENQGSFYSEKFKKK